MRTAEKHVGSVVPLWSRDTRPVPSVYPEGHDRHPRQVPPRQWCNPATRGAPRLDASDEIGPSLSLL